MFYRAYFYVNVPAELASLFYRAYFYVNVPAELVSGVRATQVSTRSLLTVGGLQYGWGLRSSGLNAGWGRIGSI